MVTCVRSSMGQQAFGRKTGFTLVELLVVIAVIGVLISLLLPAVQSARAAVRRTQCSNNLRQLALAMHNYNDAMRVLPDCWYDSHMSDGLSEWSWGALVLPFVEQNPLYDQCDFRIQPSRGINRSLVSTCVDVFRCPSEIVAKTYQLSFSTDEEEDRPVEFPIDNYGFNERLGRGNRCWRLHEITDGLSNTIMFGEIAAYEQEWDDWGIIWAPTWSSFSYGSNETGWGCLEPVAYCTSIFKAQDSDRSPDYLSSYHAGGSTVALCDGSVRLIPYTIEAETLRRLANKDDGLPVNGF